METNNSLKGVASFKKELVTEWIEPKVIVLMLIPFKHSTLLGKETT